MELGVNRCADVIPLLRHGRNSGWLRGIGEKLAPLIRAPEFYVLVAKPDINVSTKYVYEHPGCSREMD